MLSNQKVQFQLIRLTLMYSLIGDKLLTLQEQYNVLSFISLEIGIINILTIHHKYSMYGLISQFNLGSNE